MSRVGMKRFLDAVADEAQLSEKFAKAVAQLAQDNGFDVTQDDAKRLVDESPVPDDISLMTDAEPEEDDDRVLVTCAIPEERSPQP